VPPEQEREEKAKLDDLLHETRILLPGTEVLLGFLVTLPFTERFQETDGRQRVVFLCTFFATLLALVCFMLPAAYHRIARPIRSRLRFKQLANQFLVVGLVPLSISLVTVSWLVVSVVAPRLATLGAIAVGAAVGTLWWAVPLLRAHQREPGADDERKGGSDRVRSGDVEPAS
jgi:hypothetical protein